MYEIKENTFNEALKPFDIVSIGPNVGYVKEVNINECQPKPQHQVSYSVSWFVGNETKCAWWKRDELSLHGNLFVVFAQDLCNGFGSNSSYVKKLLSSINM